MAMTLEADTNVSRCCLDLVRRALPVVSAERLLAEFAHVWSQASGHSTLLVSCIANGTIRGLLLHQGTSHEFESPATSEKWSAAAAVDGMASLVDDVPTLLTAMTVVPFESGEIALGGVLLPGAAESKTDFGPLPEICGSLIAQLQQLNDVADSKPSQPDATACGTDAETHLRELKLEAMAEFAAGAGHEINNPVATIAGRAALLLKSESDPERRRALETIGGQAYRIRDMIGDAMTFARPPEPRRECLAAAAAIRGHFNDIRQWDYKA